MTLMLEENPGLTTCQQLR